MAPTPLSAPRAPPSGGRSGEMWLSICQAEDEVRVGAVSVDWMEGGRSYSPLPPLPALPDDESFAHCLFGLWAERSTWLIEQRALYSTFSLPLSSLKALFAGEDGFALCLRGIQEIFIHPTKSIMVRASLPLVEQDKLFPADEGLA